MTRNSDQMLLSYSPVDIKSAHRISQVTVLPRVLSDSITQHSLAFWSEISGPWHLLPDWLSQCHVYFRLCYGSHPPRVPNCVLGRTSSGTASETWHNSDLSKMSKGPSWYDSFALQSHMEFRLLLCCFFTILWVMLSTVVQNGSPLYPQSGQQDRGKGEGKENTSPFKGKTQKVQTSLLLPSHSSALSYMANWLPGRPGCISLFNIHIFNHVLL